MNISTYEARLKALATHNASVDNAIDGLDERVEALEGGGGGSGDGAFIITIDGQSMTSDKTFLEVKNAVLNNALIVVDLGDNNIFPDSVQYTDDESDIYINITMFGTNRINSTQTGVVTRLKFNLHPNDSLELGTNKYYTFAITEVSE